MFNKALFKQSCKANGIMWAIITFATCFMLACVMIISGNGNLTKLTGSMSNSIIESTVETTMESRGLNYYIITVDALNKYDSYYNESNNQMNALMQLNNYISGIIENAGLEEGSQGALEIQGVIMTVLNPQNLPGISFNEFYTNLGETPPTYDVESLGTTFGTEERTLYVQDYAQKNVSIFLAGNMSTDETAESIINGTEETGGLSNYGITLEDYKTMFTYERENASTGEVEKVSKFTGESGYQYIKNISNTAILTFQARLDYEMQGKDPSEKDAVVQSILGDLTATFLDTLPEEIALSLREIGELDIYSMIVGTIFYNIAGLLLPMIYMIMCSNNLIAGQVDRGSMAYVLSTSVKRRQVVFTQAMYLIGSLFAMFLCTTLTSVVCLACLGSADISLTYGSLLLLNLGAFVAMFAMSGISFLASCWFNRTKYSLGIGGGINIFFLVATILGLFGSKAMPTVVRLDSLNFFNYVSIISLFDVNSILSGNLMFIWKLAILLGIGIICYIIGAFKFQKKDLPL